MAKRKRRLTPKQIRAGFGGKRRKVAARHRHNAAPRKRAKARRHTPKRHHRRRSTPRRNPAEIIAWGLGNPGHRKKGSSMARRRSKRRAVARRHNAGRHHKHMIHHRRRRRGNPGGLGRPMDWVQGGAGVVIGGFGARVLPQVVLGASNTGVIGYLGNAVAALALGWGAHALFNKPILTGAIVAGGFGSLFSRIISDQTPYGAALSMSGLGDYGLGLYQKSNYPYPPRLQNGRGPGSSMFTWGDGSQGVATVSVAGSDSVSNC